MGAGEYAPQPPASWTDEDAPRGPSSRLYRRFIWTTLVCSLVPLLLVGWGIHIHTSRFAHDRMLDAFQERVDHHRKERNQRLRSSRDDLERTANELQQWVKNYLQALEFINHELKNQIAAMKINLLAVRDGYVGTVTQQQHEALDDVGQAIHRAEEMILNYLNLSRIERGELQVRARPLHAENDVVHPLPGIEADREELIRLFNNLVSNAVKYNKPRGRVEIEAGLQGPFLRVRIADTGVGIGEEAQKRLFSEFFREKRAETRYVPGTGLGLSIVKSIVDFYHGRIEATSEIGKGSVFTVWLPCKHTPSSSDAARAEKSGSPPGTRLYEM